MASGAMRALALSSLRLACHTRVQSRWNSLLPRLSHSWHGRPSHQPFARPSAAAVDAEPSTSDSPDEMDDQTMYAEYLAHCQQTYTIPGLVEFVAGPGGLPCVSLQHPTGARAEVCLHGAAVTSWRRADSSEMLFLRGNNTFDGHDPIRGGVGVAWPQAGVGPLPPMGLLRTLRWSVVATHAWHGEPDVKPTVSLFAESDESTLEVWPHTFEAVYTLSLAQAVTERVDPRLAAEAADEERGAQLLREAQALLKNGGRVGAQAAAGADATAGHLGSSGEEAGPGPAAPAGGARRSSRGIADLAPPMEDAEGAEEVPPPLPASLLRCVLQVHNAGDNDMAFTAALLPHFATQDITKHSKFVKLLGLGGKYVLDYSADPQRPRMSVEDDNFLFFDPAAEKRMSRLYTECDAEGQVLFCPGTRHHFDIRNVEGFSEIEVLNPGAAAVDVARWCVVVAPSRKAVPVKLAPGESWRGDATIAALNDYWPLPPFESNDPSTVPVPPKSEAIPLLLRNAGRGGGAALSYEDVGP